MPVSTEQKVGKPPTLTQRTAQANAHLAQIVERSDSKVLAAAVAEVAVSEAERNAGFARAIQIMYDALASTSRPANRRTSPAKPRKELIPIVGAGEIVLGRDDKPDAYRLQRLYGNDQLRDALDGYTLATLKEMLESVMARNPGTRPTSMRSKVSITDYIVSRLTGNN